MAVEKFTNRVRKALEDSRQIAISNLNNTIEAEHLLMAILEDKSVLDKFLSSEELNDVKIKLSGMISKFGKLQNCNEAEFSNTLAILITDLQKKTSEFITINMILAKLLEIPRISRLFNDSEGLKKKILEINKTDSANSDDPEDKMSKFAIEMVELARKNKFDPVIGRDDEIRQILEILAKKTKSNVIMVGKPGVGKTAVVNGIAQLIAKGEAKALEGFKIYNVDVGAMVAGTSHRGEFEERLKGLVKEAEDNKKVILFIDEIHIVLGAGNTSGALDAANILKPALANGSLKVIGATTYDEYRKYITKDPAFERRFALVNVKEPSIEDTVTMLRGIRERIETHHGVKISDRALVYAANMGKRYIPNRRLPDVAIDLIDMACASAVISLSSEPPEIQALKSKLWSLELEKTSIEMELKRDPTLEQTLIAVEKKIEETKADLAPIEESYNKEKSHLVEAREIKRKLEDARNRVEQAKRNNDKYLVYDLQTNIIPVYEQRLKEFSNVEVIQPIHVAAVISRVSGIPVTRLTVKENEKMINMVERIKERIFGQDQAIETVVNSIVASRLGLGKENKPIGSFLFLGPTGVGKTELSKAICQELNDSSENMVILDMSDYSTEIALTKLIGAPAGYVGYNEGGTLTEPIKEMPYNVVLLDEVDLAHQSVLNVLYQLLDEGRITDGSGTKVNFKNTVIIMTSNLGHQYISRDHVDMKSIEDLVISRFGQPLVNRIDNLVIFKPLSESSLHSILLKDLEDLNKKLLEKHLKFIISDEVMALAITQAMASNYGARILKRFIKDNFINSITKIILSRKDEDKMQIVRCYLNSEGMNGLVYGSYTYTIE